MNLLIIILKTLIIILIIDNIINKTKSTNKIIF